MANTANTKVEVTAKTAKAAKAKKIKRKVTAKKKKINIINDIYIYLQYT